MCASGVNKSSQRRQGGFTLIELMVVVVVVGILASVALPAYTEYIRRGKLSEAFATLEDYRGRMGQYFLDHKNYGAGGDCASNASASTWNTFPRTVKYFAFDCNLNDDASGYTLSATGVTGQGVEGTVYTVDQDGRKFTTQFKGTTYATGNSCWFNKTAACD